MGDWAIVVHGTGCHHNGIDDDADKLFANFVAELKRAGHHLDGATMTVGGRYEVVASSKESGVSGN